jgi:two-component system chemotaxis response regulator CheB
MKQIKVLVVDDSAVVRRVVTEQLATDPEITVIAAAADPIFAMERMKIQWPDVIVLDVEMPRMDGLTFLRKIMAERPTPVVICSTLTEKGAVTTLEALAAGAVSIVTKPKMGLKRFLEDATADLICAVKDASHVNMASLKATLGGSGPSRIRAGAGAVRPPVRKNTADVITGPPALQAMKQTTERIVALGTSTGGTQALERVLTTLPLGCPGIAVVQHMPEKFTAAFAARLNGICEVEVREAVHGERLLPGHVIIAPGGRHLMLRRGGAYYYADVIDGPLVNRHKPSVDVLFRSVAKCAGRNALGIIMTGMGDDGARGLLEMRQAGAGTLAQDEASCVVFGMPKEALKLGAAERQISLDHIAQALMSWGEEDASGVSINAVKGR